MYPFLRQMSSLIFKVEPWKLYLRKKKRKKADTKFSEEKVAFKHEKKLKIALNSISKTWKYENETHILEWKVDLC